MAESRLPPEEHVKTLSDNLQVPMHKVGEIYRMEFDRLARVARIPTYLGVLAMSNTRSILREAGKRATLR